MIETCLKRMKEINPGDVKFYMWIRRLYDSVEHHVHESSIYIKKQTDVIKEYEQLTPLIYTCFENFLKTDTIIHPQELEGITPSRVVAMSKEYDLTTLDGVTESVSFILQFLELYARCNCDKESRFIDLFYIVIYRLLSNIHTILGIEGKLKEYDVREALYVQCVRP
jgi:uncharacterized protein with von Willebrand factor type A (vWA) domain